MKQFFICLLAVFCLLNPISSYASEAISIDAKLEINEGLVKLSHLNGDSDFISEAHQLYAGDVIETMSDSKASISYADGTQMKLKSDTKVEVQHSSVRIFNGKTWHKFTKRGSEFRIEAPYFVAGIRGTTFDVDVSYNKNTINLMEGSVEVRGNSSGNVLLTEGMSVSADSKGRLSDTSKFDVSKKKSEWDEAKSKINTKKTIKTLSRPKK